MRQASNWLNFKGSPSFMARNHLSIAIFLALIGCGGFLRAQFDPMVNPNLAPQARSERELDDYIGILQAGSPQATVRRVEAFERDYPQSALLGIAYQYQMLAYRDLDDFDRTVRSGEKALKLNPDNLNTLLTLAAVLPNSVSGGRDENSHLAQAENYARLAFQELEKIKLPRTIHPQRWELLRRRFEASAHESLGHVAIKRGDSRTAIAEFEKAVELNPTPQGSQHYRLGAAYLLAKKEDAAIALLRRATELGPEEIQTMAQELLRNLGHGKNR